MADGYDPLCSQDAQIVHNCHVVMHCFIESCTLESTTGWLMVQLADCQRASASQTASLIAQENATEAAWANAAKLSESLASTQQELRSAHQSIAELTAQLDACSHQEASPSALTAPTEHLCTDRAIGPHEEARVSELLEFTDIKTELNRIEDELSTLGNENECLRTARWFNYNLQSCMIAVSCMIALLCMIVVSSMCWCS
jgi:hypothetical protein